MNYKMIKVFENYGDLTSAMAFELIENINKATFAGRIVSADFGFSNQSCSAYVNITVEDGDGEYLDDYKIRFSDHTDRYGADITLRIDSVVDDVYDDGEYVQTEISANAYGEMLADAMTSLRQRLESISQ